ncbi:hypothetical protein BAPA111461_25835 [Bacillus paramycoides]
MLITIEEKNEYCSEDGLTIILLDKDEKMPTLDEPTDEGYWVKNHPLSFWLIVEMNFGGFRLI